MGGEGTAPCLRISTITEGTGFIVPSGMRNRVVLMTGPRSETFKLLDHVGCVGNQAVRTGNAAEGTIYFDLGVSHGWTLFEESPLRPLTLARNETGSRLKRCKSTMSQDLRLRECWSLFCGPRTPSAWARCCRFIEPIFRSNHLQVKLVTY